MGWRDRDWAKFDEDEMKSFLGAATAPSHRYRRNVGRRVTRSSVLLAVAISAAATLFVTHLNEFGAPGRTAGRVLTPIPRVVEPPDDVVGVRWRASDTAPAPRAGRICVTDPRHGRFCAFYVVGERPADNLTREIERRGLRVQSSG